MRRSITFVIACLLLSGMNTGCITGIDVAPAATAKPPTREAPALQVATVGLTHRQVRNAEYGSAFVRTGKLQLVEGRFGGGVTDGKSKLGAVRVERVEIDPQIALGDFDHDGFEDAAAVLTQRVDTKTTLFELHVLRYLNGQAEHEAAYLLGSNLVIHELKIQPGIVIVVTRAPSPLSTEKAPLEIDTLRTFKIEKSRLIEVTS